MTEKFEFNPALPRPLRWQVEDQKPEYSQDGRFPKQLRLRVPLECIDPLINHLLKLAEDKSKHRPGKVWDPALRDEVEVECISISGKGQVSQFDTDEYGAYGTINPVMIEKPEEEMPF